MNDFELNREGNPRNLLRGASILWINRHLLVLPIMAFLINGYESYLIYARSLCDPVLRDAEAVHTKYLELQLVMELRESDMWTLKSGEKVSIFDSYIQHFEGFQPYTTCCVLLPVLLFFPISLLIHHFNRKSWFCFFSNDCFVSCSPSPSTSDFFLDK